MANYFAVPFRMVVVLGPAPVETWSSAVRAPGLPVGRQVLLMVQVALWTTVGPSHPSNFTLNSVAFWPVTRMSIVLTSNDCWPPLVRTTLPGDDVAPLATVPKSSVAGLSVMPFPLAGTLLGFGLALGEGPALGVG